MPVNDVNAWEAALISTNPEKSRGFGTISDPVLVQQILHPADKLFIMDVAGGGIHFNHSGVIKFTHTDHGPPGVPPTADARRVGYHHDVGFNSLFADIHVEPMWHTLPEQWVVAVIQ